MMCYLGAGVETEAGNSPWPQVSDKDCLFAFTIPELSCDLCFLPFSGVPSLPGPYAKHLCVFGAYSAQYYHRNSASKVAEARVLSARNTELCCWGECERSTETVVAHLS